MSNQQKCIALYIKSTTGNHVDLNRQVGCLNRELLRRKVDLSPYTIEIYSDPNHIGRQPGPEFHRMCDDIKSGNVRFVIVERMNRIARTSDELLKFHTFVESQQIQFISIHENVDSKNWHSMSELRAAGGAL